MRAYRLYYLNSVSAIAGAALILEAESDEAAILDAEGTFRDKAVRFYGFELWDLGRRVHRHFTA